MSLQEIEHIIIAHFKEFHLERIGVFGSFARGDQNVSSDIDILVKFKDPPSLIQLIKMEQALTKKLGIKVDLVTEGAIQNKRIRSNINKDLKVIYHA